MKIRKVEDKQVTQGYIASKQQNQDLNPNPNPSSTATESILCTTMLSFLASGCLL